MLRAAFSVCGSWCLMSSPVLAALLAATVLNAAESCGPAFDGVRSGGTRGFVIYNGLNYLGMPDLTRFGIQRIRIVDRGIWPGAGEQSTPDPHAVREVANTVPSNGTPIVLDFEGFELTGSDAIVDGSIASLMRITSAFRDVLPQRRLGFYGAPPLRDYWRAIKNDRRDPTFRAWQIQNDRLARLIGDVDVLFPSVYTFYNDREGWKKYAIAQICEARRLSRKPVIAFVWPEYHPSRVLVRNRFIDADYFQMQLELLRRYADGVVLWGGYDIQAKHPRTWDENAAWWVRTKAFAATVTPG